MHVSLPLQIRAILPRQASTSRTWPPREHPSTATDRSTVPRRDRKDSATRPISVRTTKNRKDRVWKWPTCRSPGAARRLKNRWNAGGTRSTASTDFRRAYSPNLFSTDATTARDISSVQVKFTLESLCICHFVNDSITIRLRIRDIRELGKWEWKSEPNQMK